MRTYFKKTTLALAVTGFIGTPMVLADTYTTVTTDKDVDVYETIDYDNSADVYIGKDLYTYKNTYISGYANINADQAAIATIDDKQLNFTNDDLNYGVYNDAKIVDNALGGANGNVQTNVAAGTGNQQDNAVAMAVDTKGYPAPAPLLGIADAEVFAFQHNQDNVVTYYDSSNDAEIGGSGYGLAYAYGNVQTNVAAGTGNQQKNNLAIAMAGNAVLAEATVYSLQESDYNSTFSDWHTNDAKLTGGALHYASGNIQTNVAAGVGNQQNNSMAMGLKL